jgi:hypothetical protein
MLHQHSLLWVRLLLLLSGLHLSDAARPLKEACGSQLCLQVPNLVSNLCLRQAAEVSGLQCHHCMVRTTDDKASTQPPYRPMVQSFK